MNNRALKGPAALIIAVLLLTPAVRTANSDSSEVLQVPFKLDRNRVIIPTGVSGSRPLDLILDTGMTFDGVYLFHKELSDEIDTSGAIEVRVPGAGAGEASRAIMIENGTMTFGEVTADSQKVLISGSAHTQSFPTDGVIGWNLFGHYAVEINYDNEMITLHDSSGVQIDSTWTGLPIALKKNIPFLESRIEVADGEIIPVTLYIDLASGDALELLTREDQKFKMPDDLDSSYLGTGLSGDIHGYRGRCRRLWLGEYMLSDISTAFAPAEVRSKQEGADGILGNDSIRRFNVIFVYAHGLLYLRPNKYYDLPFD